MRFLRLAFASLPVIVKSTPVAVEISPVAVEISPVAVKISPVAVEITPSASNTTERRDNPFAEVTLYHNGNCNLDAGGETWYLPDDAYTGCVAQPEQGVIPYSSFSFYGAFIYFTMWQDPYCLTKALTQQVSANCWNIVGPQSGPAYAFSYNTGN